MAANNYFGFAHGATQYAAAAPSAAYQPAQAGYAVAAPAAAAAATYTPQRPGYEAYQPAAHAAPTAYAVAASAATPAATYDYSTYARAAPAAATAYDAAKTYYQQPAAAAAHPNPYTSAEYQAKGTTYNTGYATAAAPGVARPGKTGGAVTTGAAAGYAGAVSYGAAQAPTQASYTAPAVPHTSGATLNGASLCYTTSTANYSATYPTQNLTTNNKTAYTNAIYNSTVKSGNSTWQGYKKAGSLKQLRTKSQPKTQQLHYCEVCKISCAGPQTYREHLEGQRHKKKEQLIKDSGGVVATSSRSRSNLRCELCEVVCTGSDAYAAHLRGAKHQKVMKLHTKLGKPIPEPKVKASQATVANSTALSSSTSNTLNKMGFVQDEVLSNQKTEKDESSKDEVPAAVTGEIEMVASPENEVTPVGQEYIEEMKNDEGKLISFNCKLCECKFNDPNAKDMHMKGRRHRLQFKKKVNPDLVVDVKPSGRRGRVHEEKMKRREDFIRRREDDRFWTDRLAVDERLYWEERRRFEEGIEYMEWMRRRGASVAPAPHPAFIQPLPFRMKRPETIDDRHFMVKHQQIVPKDEALQIIHKFASQIEKTLKNACEHISLHPKKSEISKNCGKGFEKFDMIKSFDSKLDNKLGFRGEDWLIRGVVRVGNLPKNLMLADDTKVNFVIVAAEFPTKTLLSQIFNEFQSQMKSNFCDETFIFGLQVAECSFFVSSGSEPQKLQAIISLTSPAVRDLYLDGEVGSGPGRNQEALLDEAKCLEALAQLRRAKWFQARPANNPSSPMVIRILRDLCLRNPTWSPLGQWAIELIVDRVVGYAAFSGSEALRKVLEAIAGGILLPGGPGICDPCEREPVDAAGNLTLQQRTDITTSAQHALRLFAFRQIHKVLGINQLNQQVRIASSRTQVQRFNRKRRRDPSAGEYQDFEGGEGKKDKKDSSDGIILVASLK